MNVEIDRRVLDALKKLMVEAIREARQPEAQTGDGIEYFRRFRLGAVRPADVNMVTDREGDMWTFMSGGWRLSSDNPLWTWDRLLTVFGPLTEVK